MTAHIYDLPPGAQADIAWARQLKHLGFLKEPQLLGRQISIWLRIRHDNEEQERAKRLAWYSLFLKMSRIVWL